MHPSNDINFDAPPEPPPPSYEISQHEFDQKTSHVLEQSAAEPPPRRVDEDGFEIWDDALFEAARAGLGDLSLDGPSGRPRQSSASGASSSSSHVPAHSSASSGYPLEKHSSAKARPLPQPRASLSGPSAVPSASGSSASQYYPSLSSPSASSSSSSSCSPPSPPAPITAEVRPLRVAKKAPRPRAPPKERPSWYEEAGLGGGSPATLQSQAGSSSSRSDYRPLRRGLTVFNYTDRDRTPPPEFTPVGPSLDGPDYETVMSYDGPQGLPEELLPAPSLSPPSLALPARSTPAPPELPASTPRPRPHPANPPPQATAPLPNPAPPLHTSQPAHAPTYPLPRVASPAPVPAPVAAPPAVPRAQAHLRVATSPAPPHAPVSRTSLYQFPGQLSNARLAFDPQSAYTKGALPRTSSSRSDEPETPVVVDASAFYR